MRVQGPATPSVIVLLATPPVIVHVSVVIVGVAVIATHPVFDTFPVNPELQVKIQDPRADVVVFHVFVPLPLSTTQPDVLATHVLFSRCHVDVHVGVVFTTQAPPDNV